jgi:hypothetical protein
MKSAAYSLGFPGRSIGLLILLTGCIAGERSEVVFPPGGMALDSTGSVQRTWVGDSLWQIRSIGGTSDQDTTLINPYLMTSDEGQIYLFETDNRLLCFDSTGALRWTQGGEGGGPGEYRNPRDLKVGPGGEVWLVDPASGRVTLVNRETGKVQTMLRMPLTYSPMITPTPAGFILYPPDQPGDLHYFSRTGDPLRIDSIPWSGFHQLESLSRQFRTAVDRKTGRWVLGFIYGNGWFAFDSAGHASERRYYVEPTRFPAVIKEHRERGTVVTSLVRNPASALDIQLVGDTVFVLFDGQEPARRRKVDMYSWETGKYFGSLMLPDPADYISIAGASFRVFSSHPVPKLAYYERRANPVVR